MDEYVCVTLVGRPGEDEAGFKGRLVAFWTHLLRTRPDDYEQVYSEAVEFEDEGGRVGRRYMVTPDVVPVLAAELRANGVDFLPVDADDLYSKAEASASDWFQIEH
ncbi:MAG: hypothetical protein U0871_10450 [Gemmataceae bacterium]